MVVSGPVQPDDGSGLETPTLHPCKFCREYISEQHIIGKDTLIMSVLPDADDFEVYTPAELQRLHQTAGQSEMPAEFAHYSDPNFQTWFDNRFQFSLYLDGQGTNAAQLLLSVQEAARMAVTGQLNMF